MSFSARYENLNKSILCSLLNLDPHIIQYNRQHSKISFTGINFYSRSRNVTQAYMDNMLKSARDRGLGVYMDANFGTRTVDQGPKCTYPNIPNVTGVL